MNSTSALFITANVWYRQESLLDRDYTHGTYKSVGSKSFSLEDVWDFSQSSSENCKTIVEKMFALFNGVVDDDECPIEDPIRSMSCGDMVQIKTPEVEYWMLCLPVGWTELTPEFVMTSYVLV